MNAKAQNFPDTLLLLPAVEINGQRSPATASGMKTEIIDSVILSLNIGNKLSDLLEKNTTLYVKNYGAGNLSTLSFRGASSSQSGVFWNGFDIKPAGAGMIDLSLVPVIFFSAMEIQYGGVSSNNGSGVMGGALYLGNTSLLGNSNRMLAGFHLGSFGEIQPFLSWQLHKPSWGSNTSVYHYKTRNDFPYYVDNREYTRNHASIEQSGMMQNFEKQWKSHHFNVGIWASCSEREIPPSTTSADQNSERSDKSVRISGRWKKTSLKGNWTSGLAYFHDYLHYREVPGDTLVLIDSKIKNSSLSGDIGFESVNNKYRTTASAIVSFTHSWIDVNKYGGKQNQSQAVINFSLMQAFLRGRMRLKMGVKQETVTGYHVPASPYMSMEGRIAGGFHARTYLSGNFRLPSMNDRFWVPGGNENLKPESGLHAGAGLFWLTDITSPHKIKVSADIFYSRIHDCITWLPSSFGYFTAMNVQQVKMNGLELSMNWMAQVNTFNFNMEVSLIHLNAINLKRLNAYDLSEGKQLIYTPRQRLSGALYLRWHSLLVSYNQSFTGKSFINRENSEYVNAFSCADFLVQYSLTKNPKVTFNLKFEVENIWDTHYEVVKYYPMPGRSFRIGLVCNINGIKNNIKL
ncbi:MAG: TonB-dependent receptor plug domain-containing protein [Bacteroidales bacterium]